MKNQMPSEEKIKEISILACQIAGINPFDISSITNLAQFEAKKQIVIGHIAIKLAIDQLLKNE